MLRVRRIVLLLLLAAVVLAVWAWVMAYPAPPVDENLYADECSPALICDPHPPLMCVDWGDPNHRRIPCVRGHVYFPELRYRS